jgi:hypothetical protein
MPLLLKTNIQERVSRLVKGKVARVGGRVNQLVDYRQCNVTDVNVIDGGFGGVAKFASISSLAKLIKHYARQEIGYWREGAGLPRDRKTIILDMHSAFTRPDLKGKFSCSISSNMIEHSPNPIWLLLNFHFVTTADGYQFHAIPHYKYTYDCFRKPTKLKHFIEDFEKMTDKTDKSHNADYVQSAIVRHGWQKSFHEKYPVAYPFMHFHVFDEENVMALFELMFEDVTNDIIKDDSFSDNIVICRNRLKESFVQKFEPLITRYRDTNFSV